MARPPPSLGAPARRQTTVAVGQEALWRHTLIDSQETCLDTGLSTARQIGADYPLDDPAAKRSFNYYWAIMYGWRFRKA